MASKMFDITTGEECWITPPSLQRSFGEFDLDPCVPENMPYATAKEMVTKKTDGLKVDWGNKRVWLNPPYGRAMPPFLEKMHNGIALIPARTDTKWFHDLVLPKANSILFMRGRVRFLYHGKSQGSPAFPSMLVAYTRYDTEMLKKSGIKGVIWEL